MKLLTFTSLFPNSVKPGHGIFVETRLRYLLASGQASARVIAPVPWFPSTHPRFGNYANFARVPANERRNGIDVWHPRYVVIPKIGMNFTPRLMANAVKPVIARMLDEGFEFDLIDAHYFYPDGVAAAMLADYFNKPLVITARGSDINLIPQYPTPRRYILQAAQRANAIITVCNALRDELVAMGVDGSKITPLRNGVDLDRFQPVDRVATRARLGLQRSTLITVGHLVPVKGHALILDALPQLPEMELLIVGDGPLRGALEQQAQNLGVADRVRFVGAVPQTDLRDYYGAADIMILASSREGWANVLLESMACGTPVVASKVWGTPEVVAAPEAGQLMEERSPSHLAAAVRALQAAAPDRSATRRYAEGFSWDSTTQGQLDLFKRILEPVHA